MLGQTHPGRIQKGRALHCVDSPSSAVLSRSSIDSGPPLIMCPKEHLCGGIDEQTWSVCSGAQEGCGALDMSANSCLQIATRILSPLEERRCLRSIKTMCTMEHCQ